MSDTTLDTLESIRESITQEISQAVNGKIATEFHDLRTHLQNALGEFVSQADLEQIVDKAVDKAASTAAGVAAGVASDSVRVLRESQDTFQDEQRQKVQSFIDEMRGRMDTFATVVQVDGLRTTMQDTHRHFESITGAHGEALDTLKKRVEKLETSTNNSISAIRADTKKMADNAEKTSLAVLDLIKTNEKREKEVDREIEALKDGQDADVKNLRRAESEMRTLDMIIRDIDERVRGTITRIENALFGDLKAKTAGLVADMSALQSSLRIPSLLFGTKWGRMFGIPAIYLFTVYWLQHPELFAHLNPFAR